MYQGVSKSNVTACRKAFRALSTQTQPRPKWFPSLKKQPAGQWYATDGDMHYTVVYWLQVLDSDFFHSGIDALVLWWDKCLNTHGDCVEKWCVPKSSYVSYMHLCKNKVLHIGVLVTLFSKTPLYTHNYTLIRSTRTIILFLTFIFALLQKLWHCQLFVWIPMAVIHPHTILVSVSRLFKIMM
jgi:hypothetical protein